VAPFVLKHPVITVNSVDLTDHCSAVSLEQTFDEAETTAFCSDFRSYAQGPGDATITATFYQDFAAGEVDATLWPLAASGGTFSVVVRAGSEPVSGSNPSYTMVSRMFTYSPISGAYGDVSTTEVTFRHAGTAGLARGTA
jgi:hypothetical protein